MLTRKCIPQVVGAFGLVILAGCASTASMKQAPLDQGTQREYSGSYTTVLRAARDAVSNSGLAIDSFDEVNDSTAVIVAKKGSSAWSWGELVRVVVQKSTGDRVVVRVTSRRKLATNVTARGDYAETLFSNIALALR